MRPDRRPAGERPVPSGMPVLRADERFVEQLAATVADHVADRLQQETVEDEGYLDADAAGQYIGATRKRIHDLTSARQLIPDGHDGRRPLYRRATLDAYVRNTRGDP